MSIRAREVGRWVLEQGRLRDEYWSKGGWEMSIIAREVERLVLDQGRLGDEYLIVDGCKFNFV